MPRRIRRRRLDGWLDPHLLFRAHCTEATHVVWLDGGADATSGISVIAVAHAGSELLTADVAAGTISTSRPVAIDHAARVRPAVVGEVFEVLAERLAEHRTSGHGGARSDDADADADAGPLGWFGWFGYELGAELVGVPAAVAETPDAAFLWIDRAVVFDHAQRTAQLVWLDGDGDADGDGASDAGVEAWAHDLVAVWERLGRPDPERGGAAAPAQPEASARPSSAPTPAPATARWRHDAETYTRLIGECQQAIRRGDAYQLCLTNRVDVDVAPDPASTYLALRESSPTHHGGYLRLGEHALLSASPELFLHVTPDGVVSTKPMKGTRPRHDDPEHDRRLRRELHESDKERAENLMIVDLMRNDLGRIAELGTVEVPSLLAVEEYPHVHQLVSTVRARLRHPLTAVDAVRSAFPAGSMTGAPKHSAMRILHDLEGGPRGVYSGAFGYLAVDGSLDLAMVIRSIVLGPTGASIGTGGGITALSVPDEEVEETRVKARALLAVLGANDA
ncbi:anthranilate synthase component 1/para-aminobenzoate synthetase [Agromyces sp. CF514]|uniref:aminodeoxychorismate synthase component I n=1 Tax=Agromyces sp. CF514 TaxID=1881031 RepID=UPI0008EE5D74|nr:aminodeoxychorismate synthase component I [Agromyces sp. CF514]SFR78890.1 anthranilate synthase component 1/para-aminobenzoate synthetase [Agromyces sp. CF514]